MAGYTKQLPTTPERPQEQRSLQSTSANYDSSHTRYLGSPNYKFKGFSPKRDRNWPNRPWINLQEEGSNERAPSTGNDGGNCVQFTLASYNLLAQSLVEKNLDLYAHCPPALLAWDHRKQLLLDELIHHDADVSTTILKWTQPYAHVLVLSGCIGCSSATVAMPAGGLLR